MLKFITSANAGIEQMVQNLLCSYLNETGMEAKHFKGVPDKNIEIVESIAEVDIKMYTVSQNNENKLVAQIYRRSLGRYSNELTLIKCLHHICYVPDPAAVFKLYQCRNCETFF